MEGHRLGVLGRKCKKKQEYQQSNDPGEIRQNFHAEPAIEACLFEYKNGGTGAAASHVTTAILYGCF